MATKGKGTSEGGLASGLFQDRAKLMGSAGQVNADALDARLLWMVVGILASRCASIQLGVTRDGGAWAVQYWDGKLPVKEYFNSTDDLNRSFAALVRAAEGKGITPEWDEIVRGYGW